MLKFENLHDMDSENEFSYEFFKQLEDGKNNLSNPLALKLKKEKMRNEAKRIQNKYENSYSYDNQWKYSSKISKNTKIMFKKEKDLKYGLNNTKVHTIISSNHQKPSSTINLNTKPINIKTTYLDTFFPSSLYFQNRSFHVCYDNTNRRFFSFNWNFELPNSTGMAMENFSSIFLMTLDESAYALESVNQREVEL